MTKIIFIWYVITGVVTPQDDVDGRKTYAIHAKDYAIDYAYRGEVFHWIETGNFVYNEDLED